MISFRSVILWRDVRISAAIFTSGMTVLLALSLYSVIVVATCLAIPAVVVTMTIRALFSAKCALVKQPIENPFQYWLNEGWEIGTDRMGSINGKIADSVNTAILEIKKIFLVQDFADSFKGLMLLYVWYYIGKNISGMALLFIVFIGLFTIPKIYDLYRREIDSAIKQIRLKHDNFYSRILENIPGFSSKKTSLKAFKNGIHKEKEEKTKEEKEE